MEFMDAFDIEVELKPCVPVHRLSPSRVDNYIYLMRCEYTHTISVCNSMYIIYTLRGSHSNCFLHLLCTYICVLCIGIVHTQTVRPEEEKKTIFLSPCRMYLNVIASWICLPPAWLQQQMQQKKNVFRHKFKWEKSLRRINVIILMCLAFASNPIKIYFIAWLFFFSFFVFVSLVSPLPSIQCLYCNVLVVVYNCHTSILLWCKQPVFSIRFMHTFFLVLYVIWKCKCRFSSLLASIGFRQVSQWDRLDDWEQKSIWA